MEGRRLGNKNPFTALLEQTFDTLIRECMFCLPGKVTAFDPDTQRAQVEAGVQKLINGEPRTIPVINNVPVKFAGNDKWYLFHEITPETEGLIHFSQRAVDAWLDQGGPTAPNDTRKLSSDDAFFVPGVRSRPNQIPDFKNEGVGLSNYAGDVFIHLTDSGVSVKGNTDVDGNVTATGNISADGDVSAGGLVKAVGDVVADKDGTAISLLTHIHNDSTGSPTSPPTGNA